MAVKVRIPSPLQKVTGGQSEVTGEGGKLSEVIDSLESQYPGLKEKICDADGKIRRFVNIYVNDEDIRFLQAEETSVTESDEISIIPAIAGGTN